MYIQYKQRGWGGGNENFVRASKNSNPWHNWASRKTILSVKPCTELSKIKTFGSLKPTLSAAHGNSTVLFLHRIHQITNRKKIFEGF